WPGHLPAGRHVGGIARSIDVAPTLLDLAVSAKAESVQGHSLLPIVNSSAPAAESAYAETYFPLFYMNWAPLRSHQDERWKFIDAPEPELYDLSADAGERTNLAAREPARAAALKRALDAMTNGKSGAMSERAMDRETVQKLAAL